MNLNIKDELTRKVIEEELLLDNALLQYAQNEDEVEVVIRYIESFNKIREYLLGVLSFDEYLYNRYEHVEINKESNTIAFFKKINNKLDDNREENYELSKLYNYEKHLSLGPAFIDLHYKEAHKGKKKTKKIIPEYD